MKRIPTDELRRFAAGDPKTLPAYTVRAVCAELLACREERDPARALLELVAGNLANFAAKREGAPASAEAHLDEAMEALVAYQPKDGYGEAAKALRLDLWREGPMRALQDERDAARAEAERLTKRVQSMGSSMEHHVAAQTAKLRAETEKLRAELAAVKRQRDELVAAALPVLDKIEPKPSPFQPLLLALVAAVKAAEQPKPQQPEVQP